jgi:hypothetical protein
MPDSAPRPNADPGFSFAWRAEGLTRIPERVYTGSAPASRTLAADPSRARHSRCPGERSDVRP